MSDSLLIQKIDGQIKVLNDEIKPLFEQRTAREKRGFWGYFSLGAIKQFLYNEERIKNKKLDALNKLKGFVKADNLQSVISLESSYARNRYCFVFSGFRNRTKKLFDEAVNYSERQETTQAAGREKHQLKEFKRGN